MVVPGSPREKVVCALRWSGWLEMVVPVESLTSPPLVILVVVVVVGVLELVLVTILVEVGRSLPEVYDTVWVVVLYWVDCLVMLCSKSEESSPYEVTRREVSLVVSLPLYSE